MDFGCATHLLALFGGEGTRDDVFAHIVFFGQVEEGADFRGTFGPKTTWDGVIGEAGNGPLASLDNGQIEHGNVLSDDASSDGLALALSGATLPISLVSLVHQKPNAGVGQDALTHGKSLFIISTGNAEDVSGKLLAEDGSIDFLGHATFVEVVQAFLVIDFNDFLEPRARAGNIDL